MPRMGYDMEKATIVSWLKYEGDPVVAHEVIAEIETDKAVVEFEAPASGLLLRIVCQAGATVAVGKPIAYIGDAGEELPDTEEPDVATSAPGRQVVAAAPKRGEKGRQPASPLARRLAAELSIDLSQVHGTGPRGRVTRDDVLAFRRDEASPSDGAAVALVQTPPETPPSGMQPPIPTLPGALAPRQPNAEGIIPIGKMGQAIARRTQATFNEAPHFYVTVRVDMTDAMTKRDDLNRQLPASQRVSVNDLVIKACAVALQRHPAFNATFEEDRLRVHPHVNIGMAVALPEGLMVPAILACEEKSVADIAAAAKDLAERTRAGLLRQEEYTGTFSVSNLGMFGVSDFTAIIVSPQVAVLAVSAVEDAAVPLHGDIHVRKMMNATLSADHRAINGVEAALFAGEIKRLLENPAELG